MDMALAGCFDHHISQSDNGHHISLHHPLEHMQLACMGGGAGALVDGAALLLQPLQQLQVSTLGSQIAQADWPTRGRPFHLPHCSPCRAARALERL